MADKTRFQVVYEDLEALQSAARAGDLSKEQCKRQAAELLLEAAEIQRILVERSQAAEAIIPFCKYVDSQYVDAAHLHVIGKYLGEVEKYIKSGGAEGIGRLILTVPPRHGKTLTVSKRWPAFLLGRHQDWRIALVSYGAELAEDASRANRSLIRDEPRFAQLFPGVSLSGESQAVNRWALAGRSPDDPSFVAVGVGGPLTGRGFHLIVIDDPIKGRAEAESETIRKGLHDWYKGTLRTRLEPGGAIVIIQTRWHEDDLVGFLLAQQEAGEGETWTLVNLPALAETKDQHGKPIKDPLGRKEGAALWQERFNRAILTATKKAVGSYDWESQFQGHPKPPQGSKILREWLKVIPVEKLPQNLRWARYYDLAISSKEGASYTASIRGAFDEEGNLYLAGMLRGRWEWPAQRKIMRTTMLAEASLGVLHGVESALHGTAAVQEFRRDKGLRGIAFKPVDVHVDKLTRALPWIALAEDGKVSLVAGPWVSDFIEEAAAFTGHKDLYDDQIDAVSGVVALLDQHKGKVKANKNPFYS
jgi:predicted phage terminase large subunit-like protein